ncbi:uncharacterized protein LOC129808619 [Phlebotomus papatasi]|uniref:uncharacterized protein LOC129808619 n=1 Tax=Phlebotomus papatasi TaxID=29031 RepID=UPI00248359E3|nr:uncharacterized protein LOC129808619 [Phlebotomus papatasi]
MLHFDKKDNKKDNGKIQDKKSNSKSHYVNANKDDSASEDSDEEIIALHTTSSAIILPTAIIKARGKDGQWHPLRALLDTGSQDSFISENAAQSLNLPRTKVSTNIKGIGEVHAATCKSTIELYISPRFESKFKASTKAFIMPKLTSLLPSNTIKTSFNPQQYKNLPLADPTYNIPGNIDLILGANVYAAVLKPDINKEENGLMAQNTKLGWIILGKTTNVTTQKEVISMVSLAEIDKTLRDFWEIDVANNTTEDLQEVCELHFKDTHTRLENGRCQVRLPFKKETEMKLGDSRSQALARFLSMERKFATNPELKQEYAKFMNEYEELGHMTMAPNYIGSPYNVYYLPHHAVFKMESTTTKTRVVFDASCKSSSGISLNNILHTGPKIQQDLTQILTRWRKYSIVCTADVEKMFRQINLHEDDRNYHRILWRDNTREAVKEYQLNTVTYGTGPATYLSVRVLKQLAIDEGDKYPKAANILQQDFYVDDMLTGAHSQEEAEEIYIQITKLMALGQMNIRKWTSNSMELMQKIPEESREKGIIQIKEDETIKPLGIH